MFVLVLWVSFSWARPAVLAAILGTTVCIGLALSFTWTWTGVGLVFIAAAIGSTLGAWYAVRV
jgi:hypothetical protein